jgi:hypothetical protein
MICALVITQAQTPSEKELIKLLNHSKVIYCNQDTLLSGKIIKKVELVFEDTSMFYTAYLSSASFTKKVSACDFIAFDDNLSFDFYEVKDLPKLKRKLDRIMRSTDFKKINKKYIPWWYAEE